MALSLIIAVGFGGLASWQFVKALVSASATRARRKDSVNRRSLELGWTGIVVIAVIFMAVMLLLAWMSNTPLLSRIVALVLSAVLVLGNTYLKGNGIDCCPAMLLLWAGNVSSSARHVQGGWEKWYIYLQVIAAILILAGTLIGNLRRAGIRLRIEKEDAEKVEEDVEASSDEESEDEESDDDNGEAAGDDDDDEDEDRYWYLAEKILIGLIVIVVFVILYLAFGDKLAQIIH